MPASSPGRRPAVKRSFPRCSIFLQSARPQGATDINGCLADYAGRIKMPGLVIVLSDLFDSGGFQDGLRALTYKNVDIHLVQVLDRQELAWNQTGNLVLTEVESGARKALSVDRHLLERYRQRMQTFLSEVRAFCRRYGVGYHLHDTGISFEDFLTDFMTRGRLFR